MIMYDIDHYGLLNQITAVPNVNAANIFSNYEYTKSIFAPLADIPNTIRNYKLLKRNRYLKLI